MLDPPANDKSVVSLAKHINNIDYIYLNVKHVAVKSIETFSKALKNRQSQVRSCCIVFLF